VTLPRLPEYIQALVDVGHRDVGYVADSYTAPGGDRYVWLEGGDLPAAEERACHLLAITHHIWLVPGLVVGGRRGSLPVLSDPGLAQLRLWGVAL
jgi:hypothetical protein